MTKAKYPDIRAAGYMAQISGYFIFKPTYGPLQQTGALLYFGQYKTLLLLFGQKILACTGERNLIYL